jgi:hypothetical protein
VAIARLDAVLGIAALGRDHLAAAAQPTPAADRIEVDAEGSRCIEDGRALLEPAAPARRREDDLRLGTAHRFEPRPAVPPVAAVPVMPPCRSSAGRPAHAQRPLRQRHASPKPRRARDG